MHPMVRHKPIIQEIRDRFDHFGETIGNREVTSSIKIASNQHGYTVTSYPQGTYGYEGFTVDVHAPQGIFGKQGPTRIEMFREKDPGVMWVDFTEVTSTEEGRTNAWGTVAPHAARENLLLPGDPGFELLDQLHAELAARRTIVADALGMLGINAIPTTLKYTSQTTSGGRYDQKNLVATHERATLLEIGGRDTAINDRVYTHIKLDGSRTAPMPSNGSIRVNWLADDPMVFRAGEAVVDWELTFRRTHPPVGDEALLAFAGLHANFAKLYR
jgi:hypothetical protein